ncbi:MAG: hypothetical protein WCA10_18350 [Terracidiphilus sp.]
MIEGCQVLQNCQIFTELETRGDELIMGELQLVVDQPDLTLFDSRNHLVGSGYRKKAIQQRQPLFQGCHVFEFIRDKEVFRTSEKRRLCLRDLYNEHGLLLGKTAEADHLMFHLFGLFVTDIHIGASNTAQDICESSNEAGARWFQIVELPHNFPYRLGFISTETIRSTAALAIFQPPLERVQKFHDAHNRQSPSPD